MNLIDKWIFGRYDQLKYILINLILKPMINFVKIFYLNVLNLINDTFFWANFFNKYAWVNSFFTKYIVENKFKYKIEIDHKRIHIGFIKLKNKPKNY